MKVPFYFNWDLLYRCCCRELWTRQTSANSDDVRQYESAIEGEPEGYGRWWSP